MNAVAKAAISTVGEMPRLSEALAEGDAALKEGRESFYEKISKDDDVLKVLVHVMTGMRDPEWSSTSPRMRELLPPVHLHHLPHLHTSTWDRYKHIWDVDKDAFMRRYAKANRALTAFETDIARYRELRQDIQSEEGYSNIGFIRIDCGPLKQALMQHCNTWQAKFTNLLNTNAADESCAALREHGQVRRRSSRSARPTSTSSPIRSSCSSRSRTRSRRRRRASSRSRPMYRMLEKFEVQVKEDELERFASAARRVGEATRRCCKRWHVRLQKAKADFKDDLLNSLTQFTRE